MSNSPNKMETTKNPAYEYLSLRQGLIKEEKFCKLRVRLFLISMVAMLIACPRES